MDELNETEIQIRLAEYERSQEVGHHTDTIIHEVTAIVWGANTLLLGFILEVPCEPNRQVPVIVASLIGIAMSAYVPWVHSLTKRIQRIAYRICRTIEDEVPLPHRLNNEIHADYPSWKPGLAAVWFLTILFVGAWLAILIRSGVCLCRG
jgi:hypothetical protein